jgi:hypothetical protein
VALGARWITSGWPYRGNWRVAVNDDCGEASYPRTCGPTTAASSKSCGRGSSSAVSLAPEGGAFVPRRLRDTAGSDLTNEDRHRGDSVAAELPLTADRAMEHDLGRLVVCQPRLPARLVGREPASVALGARRDQRDALGAQCCSRERRTRGVAWARAGVVEAAKRTARCALSRGAGRSSEAVASRRKRSSYHSVPGARRIRSHPWASRSALRAASAARALVSCLVGLLSFQGRRQARKDCETQSAPGLPCSRAKNCAVA